MASRIRKRLLAGIVIGLVLGGAIGVLLSTGRIGELEERIGELEALGPDADDVALLERIRGLTEQLEGNLTLIETLSRRTGILRRPWRASRSGWGLATGRNRWTPNASRYPWGPIW